MKNGRPILHISKLLEIKQIKKNGSRKSKKYGKHGAEKNNCWLNRKESLWKRKGKPNYKEKNLK